MRSEQRTAIAKRAVEMAGAADEAEVLVSAADTALTRFTHQVCNQNVASADAGISVRAVIDKRTGVARTNRFDDASLREVVDRAVEMARLAPQDPLHPGLPRGGAATAPPGAYDSRTADAPADLRASMCEAIFGEAESAGQWCAGYVSTSAAGYTVVNTSGADASFDGTDAAVNVKMNASDSTGFAEAYSARVGNIDAAAVGRRATSKAAGAMHPVAVDPGPWTVVLEPSAFGELFVYLAEHFSAQTFDEGASFCSDGLNRSYFAENVCVYDDYAHTLNPGMPFDFEGHPTIQPLPLVENGIVRNVVTDSYYAHKLQRPNTGHALPAPNAFGPHARNLVIGGGTKSVDQLVAETKRGLLVTRFWYIRTVDRKKAVVTGMTRDGTFLIEDGKITRGVRNLRFNQSILECLRHSEFASEQKRTGSYHFALVAPAAKIENFRFTSTTEF